MSVNKLNLGLFLPSWGSGPKNAHHELKQGRGSRGLSMLEIVLGVGIFAIAMLPILTLSQSSAKGSYSMSRHLLASQVAASVLDRLLAMPFDLAKSTVEDQNKKPVVVLTANDSNLAFNDQVKEAIGKIPAPVKGKKFSEDLERSLNTYEYVIEKGKAEADDSAFNILVTVQWLEVPGEKNSMRKVTRQASKFKEE